MGKVPGIALDSCGYKHKDGNELSAQKKVGNLTK